MARPLVALILVLTPSSLLHAQPALIDLPIAGRPVDFSNIVGKYEIKASAAPTVVHVEESIFLKIEIIGAGPAKYEPKRSTLKLIPAFWEKDFYLQDVPAEDRVMRDEKTWLFVYRLKPKRADVAAIPLITLHYYDPSQSEKNRFQKDYGGPIPIAVTAKPDPQPNVVDIEVAPQSFYMRASSQEVLRSTPVYELNGYRLAAWLALPPILGVFTTWAYRRSRPGRQELARRYQNEAAKRALTLLAAGSPWNVVTSYLRERFDFSALDGTPIEVEKFLKRRGFTLSLCRQSRAFFEACDTVRFTQSFAEADRLIKEAECLIHALEADPCMHG
jgi:hypothetical protein